MSKLRCKEIEFLVEDYVLYDRNEVSKVPKLILILSLFLLHKDVRLVRQFPDQILM